MMYLYTYTCRMKTRNRIKEFEGEISDWRKCWWPPELPTKNACKIWFLTPHLIHTQNTQFSWNSIPFFFGQDPRTKYAQEQEPFLLHFPSPFLKSGSNKTTKPTKESLQTWAACSSNPFKNTTRWDWAKKEGNLG